MMVDLPRVFRTAPQRRSHEAGPQLAVAVALEAIGGEGRLASLAALFPHVAFEAAPGLWPDDVASGAAVLIAGVDAALAADLEHALARLSRSHGHPRIAVVLRNADVTTTRRLMRAGASDVLPAPVGEPALAICLERLLHAHPHEAGGARKAGEIVALLKAGGGVGATALAVQSSFLLAQRAPGGACVADLDLQFGSASLYMDLPEAATIIDCLGAGQGLAETPYASALATHRSGVRLLAAPREVVPLETLTPDLADGLVRGLRRDFGLTLVDLPAVWTDWTDQVLVQADRIVLVTRLAVPHIQLVKRQLRMLAAQRLDEKPLTLVCNAVTGDQARTVPVKAAERALGRDFDLVVPEDQRLMDAALNQGLELAAVRRGSKLEKAVALFADAVAAGAKARSGP
jgi:pilus assembly protein CpaE